MKVLVVVQVVVLEMLIVSMKLVEQETHHQLVHPKDFLEDLIFHVEQVVEVVEQLLQDQPLTHLMEVVQEEMVLQLQFQDLQQLMLVVGVGPVILLLVLLED